MVKFKATSYLKERLIKGFRKAGFFKIGRLEDLLESFREGAMMEGALVFNQVRFCLNNRVNIHVELLLDGEAVGVLDTGCEWDIGDVVTLEIDEGLMKMSIE